MLGSVEHRPARMMICDFLIANGRETVDLIGGFIYDKRWFVSRNVAMILGEIGNERGVTFLKKSALHTDARVRLETLRAAKRILGEDAERILRGFLNDPDVDLRKRALRALGQRKEHGRGR
jgi:HEAT repeat protein